MGHIYSGIGRLLPEQVWMCLKNKRKSDELKAQILKELSADSRLKLLALRRKEDSDS